MESIIPAQVESLEERRLLFALSGYEWSDTDVSFSYMPDGTSAEGGQSSLYAWLDTMAPTEVWQREFARALQAWANVSNLNFTWVADPGDIRLGAVPLDGPGAYAYYPGSGLGGDIFLDPGFVIEIG